MALSACDLLRGRDGSELIGPREGRFFGGKQLKKESISNEGHLQRKQQKAAKKSNKPQPSQPTKSHRW
jgi:hypothetical protein